MTETVAETATGRQAQSSRFGGLARYAAPRYVAEMATRPQKPQRPQRGAPGRPNKPTTIHASKVPHLYIAEHMEAKHLDVPRLAGRLGQHEKSVYRAIREPSRVWKEVQAWADAIGLEDWRDLTMPPGRPSLDARLDRLPKEFQEVILKAVGKA